MTGATVVSAPDAGILRLRSTARATDVTVTVTAA